MKIFKKTLLTFLIVLLICPISNINAYDSNCDSYQVSIIIQNDINNFFIKKDNIDEKIKKMLSNNFKSTIEHMNSIIKADRHMNPALYLRKH